MVGFGSSIWMVILCLLVAIAIGYFLYGSKIRNDGKYSKTNIGLFLLRVLSSFLIGLLLLSPFIRLKKSMKEKPIIVLAIDNSSSILNQKDSMIYRNEILELKELLSNKFEIKTLSYSDKITQGLALNYTEGKGKRTNISQVFNEINDVFEDRNVGAVVLAGDGHYNSGNNPIFSSYQKEAPFITWGFGDSTIYPDLQIQEVINNDVAYRDDRFPVLIRISAHKMAGKNAQVKILQNGKLIKSSNIKLNNDNDFKEVEFLLDANSIGLKKYTAIVTGDVQEKNIENNRVNFMVDVLDNRSTILVVYNSPHPDISAWVNSLKDENIKVKAMSILDVKITDVEKSKALIYHGLPRKGNDVKFSQIHKINKPSFFVGNLQTDYNQLNNILGSEITVKSARSNSEVSAKPQESFLGFNVSEDLKQYLLFAPPLQVPYDVALNNSTADILATQQYGAVSTKIPLIAFTNKTKLKYGIWFGEGFWKWRMYEYAKNKNFNQSNELAHYIVQNIVSGADLRKFKISPSKKYFYDDEQPTFEAEIYNNSYEIIKNESIQFVVKGGDSISQKYTFDYGANGYGLRLASLPPGAYSYVARVLDRRSFQPISGRFIIKPLDIEKLSDRANFKLLRDLSAKHNGKAFIHKKAEEVSNYIINMVQPKTKLYHEEQLKHWINWELVLGSILLLLGLEWFIRKREGVV